LESGPAVPTSPCETEPGPAAAPEPDPELDEADPPDCIPVASGDRESVIEECAGVVWLSWLPEPEPLLSPFTTLGSGELPELPPDC